MTQKNEQAPQPEHEEEIYLEPAPMNRRDIAGVILALVALTAIGLGGYVWLTPGMSFAKLIGGTDSKPAAATETGSSDSTASTSGTDTAAEGEELRCPTCGMFADRSMSHVAAHWSDGQELHYDSWDCVFVYAEEHSELLESAHVIDHESSLDEPRWLDASTAWYLYDTTERVAGSMPPFTAAFSSREAAVASQQELGGELLDFSALRGKWGAADAAGSAAAGSESAAGPEEAQPSEETEAQARPAEPETAAEAAETSAAEEPLECPYCGMLPANSGTHIAAEWSDGAEHHYDCFDCMFNHLKESSATLANVKVSRYGSPGSAPDWLDAASAVFLYDTKRIKGSMPPYTAAFSDEASAMAAQAELGGELVNWTALRAKWGL